MKKTILITGANGQLGSDLVDLIDSSLYEVAAFTKQDLDITDYQAVEETVRRIKPDWILHAAAYTNVEAAEDEGKEMNWLVNATGTKNVAKAAQQIGSKMVYISTDYVFDGVKKTEYEVDDQVNPLNEYGKAKLAGESAVLKLLKEDGYVIRTSWVFSKIGKNFVNTMRKLSKEKEVLTIVSDQYGRPTSTKDLTAFIFAIIDQVPESGVYHFSNDGVCNWYEFAVEILKDVSFEGRVIECSSNDFVQKAKRPQNSILSLKKTKENISYEIPNWKVALERDYK